MSWRVLAVRQEGTLTGEHAGRTWRVLVEFPWGQDECEFAPTLTLEDIRNTFDSMVANRQSLQQGRLTVPVNPHELKNLRS